MRTATSTSIHSLNADRGLSTAKKIAYLFLNWLNNLFPYWDTDKRIGIHFYGQEENWRDEWDKTYRESSVGRRLSDLFWRTLPWDKIQKELGEIHVFDTGCGQGNYGKRLLDASSGRIATYTGIDLKRRENWSLLEKEYPQFKFIESSSSAILPIIPEKANFFITQSSIEHFDSDLSFFRELKTFIDRTTKPIIQIHNVPAKAILPLYLFHGIRQYTPRTLSKITRLFEDTSCYLYGLGGLAGKIVQFHYFTWPLLIKRGKALWSKDLERYDHDVREAIEQDVKHPTSSPIFWVLVIHSHVKNKIW